MDEREFEQHLKEALRPVEAPDGLAERIIAKANARKVVAIRPARQVWARWGALAAMLTLGSFGTLRYVEHRQAEQIEARKAAQQFELALQITSEKITGTQKKLIVAIPLHPGSSGQ